MAAPPWMPAGVVGWPPNGLSGGIHTRLLGFVKTALMRQLVSQNSLVCDLFCGRGLDTERWAEAGIGRYMGVDLSASALEESREQWEQHDRPFPAEFCELDPCMVDLEEHLQNQGLPADIVSCLAHLQDAFTSEEMVKRLLKNVAAVLKPGGFFFGTAPDSSTIWYKYQKAVQEAMKAGNLRLNGALPAVRTDIYKITFDDDRFLPFGSKYHMRFTDDGLPPQPQLLVHFPSLIRLAKEVGLECVEIQNLMEFYDDYSGPFADVLRTCCGSLMDLKGVPVLDPKGRLNLQAMDVLSLYTTFIFKKGDLSSSVSMGPAFKASNSAAKYLTNFPCQHPVKFPHREDEDAGRKEQDPVKSEEHVSLMLNSIPLSSVQNEQQQQEAHPNDSELHTRDLGKDLSASRPHVGTFHGREDDVSEVMREASLGQNIHQDSICLDNNTEGSLHEEELTKRDSGVSSRSSFQVDRTLKDGHLPEDQPLEHPAGEIHPGDWPSKEAVNSDANEVSVLGREKMHPSLSPNMKHRASRGLSSTRPSASTERGQLNLKEIDGGEKTSPVGQSSSLRKGRNESLDESRGVVQHHNPRLADHSPQRSPRRTRERMDESSRGEVQQEPAPTDRSHKHYMRRGHEKSSRGENQQELLAGDNPSRHYVRRTSENRDDNRLENQQDQQRADHQYKRHQQRALESVDQSHMHNKKESPPKDERRTDDNLDDRSRNGSQQPEPSGADKHYIRRPSDNSDERHRSVQAYDKGRLQSVLSKWAGRSGSQQESHESLQSSQGVRSSCVVLKNFQTNSGKPSAKTAYRDEVMTSHLSSK